MNWSILIFGLVGIVCCIAPFGIVPFLRQRNKSKNHFIQTGDSDDQI